MEKSIKNDKSPRTIQYYYARLQQLKDKQKQERQSQYEKLSNQAMQLKQLEQKFHKQTLLRTNKEHAEPRPIMSKSYAFGSSTPRNTMISESIINKHCEYRRSSISIGETVKRSTEFCGKAPKKRASSVGEITVSKPINCDLSPSFTRNSSLRLSTSRLPVLVSSTSKKPQTPTENTLPPPKQQQPKTNQSGHQTPLTSKLPRKSSAINVTCTPKISNDTSKSTIERRFSFNFPVTTNNSSDYKKTGMERRRQSMIPAASPAAPSPIKSKCVVTAPIKSGFAVDRTTKIVRPSASDAARSILSECQNTPLQRNSSSLIQRHIDNLKYQAAEKCLPGEKAKKLAKEHEEIIKRLAESMAKTKLRREAELEKENQKRLDRIESERKATADTAEKLRSETAERQRREAQEREERRKRVQMIMTRIRAAQDAAESTTIPTNPQYNMTSISMFGSVISQ